MITGMEGRGESNNYCFLFKTLFIGQSIVLEPSAYNRHRYSDNSYCN